MKALVLFGGGLDSGALVALNKAAVHPLELSLLYIDYGAKARRGEIAALDYFAEAYKHESYIATVNDLLVNHPLVDGGAARAHSENYVPGRNLIFAALATSFAAARKIPLVLMGFHLEPPESVYEDAKARFLRSFNSLSWSAYGAAYPAVFAPYGERRREDYIGSALCIEPGLFERTFSCYESRSLFECGYCTHCVAKKALRAEIDSRT